MKKAVIILALLFLMGSVSALEMTRIYGLVTPETSVKLNVVYSKEGVIYNQAITKTANMIGLWEFKFSSDPGTIELKVTYEGKEKEYSFPAGKEFRARIEDEIEQSTTTSIATTTAIDNSSIVNETAEKNETIEGTTATKITGGSIFDSNIIKTINIANLKTLKIILIIFGLFVFIVIANLVSFYLAGIMFKPGTGVPAEKIQEKIKITKLSEKVAQAQKEIADAEKQIEEFKKKVEKVEVFS